MNLQALCKQIEINVVNDTFGFGEEIIYKQVNAIESIITRAMVTNGNFQFSTKSEKAVFEDEMSFLSVVLQSKPLRGEKITYDNEVWKVEAFQGKNPYDIFCKRNKSHKPSRSTRKKD